MFAALPEATAGGGIRKQPLMAPCWCFLATNRWPVSGCYSVHVCWVNKWMYYVIPSLEGFSHIFKKCILHSPLKRRLCGAKICSCEENRGLDSLIFLYFQLSLFLLWPTFVLFIDVEICPWYIKQKNEVKWDV